MYEWIAFLGGAFLMALAIRYGRRRDFATWSAFITGFVLMVIAVLVPA